MKVYIEVPLVQDHDDTDLVVEVVVLSVHHYLFHLEVHASLVVHLQVHTNLDHHIFGDPALDDDKVVHHTSLLLVLEGRAFVDLLGLVYLWEVNLVDVLGPLDV